MTMRNKYVRRSHISEKKFRQLVKLFSLDLDAIQISKLSHLNRNTVNRYLKIIRTRIAELCEIESPLSGEVEIDESYFGAKRVKGKRGRGASGKTLKSSITRLRKLNIPINILHIDPETKIKASLKEPIYWMTNAKISAEALLTQINEIELNENKTVNKKKLILQRMYEEYINELNNLFDKWNALRLMDQLDDG